MTTISDVAAAAGVSVATVSRVINGNANVSPETLAKVTKAIQDLNYRPNLLEEIYAEPNQKESLYCFLIFQILFIRK